MVNNSFFSYLCHMKTLKNYTMKVTHKKYGHSYELNPKQAADFFFKNDHNNYDYPDSFKEDTSNQISNTQFYLACIGLAVLSISSVLLHIHLNY